ncbi:meiotic chromosome segregation protein [Cenococcum geophilum]
MDPFVYHSGRSANSPLHPPSTLYARIASSPRTLIQTLTIPPRSGLAFRVPATCIFRLSTPLGPQVGDLNIWNAQDPRSYLRKGDRLWSCLPFMRPLCGVIRDRCGLGERVRTRWGGRCHDLLGTRCDPYVNQMLTSTFYDYHCHSNLVRVIIPYGLTEFDAHDVLNFFAEQDLLKHMSRGDLSTWGWDMADEAASSTEGSKEMKETCRSIKVDIWDIAEEKRVDVLRGWELLRCPEYRAQGDV